MLHGVTRGYKWVIKDYRRLEGARRGYRELQGVERGHRVLQRVIGGYRRLQGVTRDHKGYKKKYRTTGA